MFSNETPLFQELSEATVKFRR